MKIVITGGLGHIGSYLIDWLNKQHDLTAIDNLSGQRHRALFGTHVKFIEGDILAVDLERIFTGSDVVIHLAAVTDAASTLDRRAECWGVNYAGTCLVARACKNVGVPLILPSTTSVYGVSETNQPLDETSPLNPQSPYAESKLAAEYAIEGMDGLRWSILRLGTIFGYSSGMRYHTAVNSFVFKAIAGLPLTVWSTALDQVRPYLALQDAATAIRHVIDRDLYGRRFNVVTDNYTPREIIEVIKEFFPTAESTLVDSRIMNQLSYRVTSAALESTGWQATGRLRDYVQKMSTLCFPSI